MQVFGVETMWCTKNARGKLLAGVKRVLLLIGLQMSDEKFNQVS